MITKTPSPSDEEAKPDYVLALEKAYGPPSQKGFGGAVFFEQAEEDSDLQQLATKYYQYFVGELWERWGAEAWMSPWKEVYAREEGVKHDIVKELQGLDDRDAVNSVPLILEVMDDAQAAKKALAEAYNDLQVADLRVYNVGDGEAMSGLIVAGLRQNGEATFVTVLMD